MRTRKKQKIADIATRTQQTLEPVQSILHTYLTLNETIAFSRSYSLFNRYAQHDVTWRNLYKQHFGKLYHFGDYKLQFIAEFLFRKILAKEQQQIEAPNTARLKEHLAQYPNRPWTFFYLTKIAKLEKSDAVVNVGFTTLRALDPRAIDLLMQYFQSEISNLMVSQDELKTFIELMKQLPAQHTHKRMFSLAYSFLFNNCFDGDVVVKDTYRNETLALFYDAIDEQQIDSRDFLAYFAKIFRNLNLISRLQSYGVLLHQPAENTQNAYEILTDSCLLRRIPPLKATLLNFIKDRADKQDGLAAFYYADYLRCDLLNRYTLKQPISDQACQREKETIQFYYLQAYGKNLFKALNGLLSIIQLKPNLPIMNYNDLFALALKGIQHNDEYVYNTLAYIIPKIPHWYQNRDTVWILLLATMHDTNLTGSFKSLPALANHPEKNQHIQCALAFIYASKDKWLDAHRLYNQAVSVDGNIFQDFLNAGSKYVADLSKYKNIVDILATHHADNAIEKRCMIRIKR